MVNITVIERAYPPIEPSSMPPKLRVVIGAIVGLLSGAAAAVLLGLIKA
jgi:uncharacterized protein involved in exopolysaccharide biosynthesis